MRRKLTDEEVYMIVRAEEECGMNTLLQELFTSENPVVYCEIDEKGCFGEYTVEEKHKKVRSKK